MALQMRPDQRGGGGGYDARFYAPSRDLAYVFPGLLGGTIIGLRDQRDPFIDDVCAQFGLVEENIAEAALKYALGVELMATRPEYGSPEAAFVESGFFSCHVAAQFVVSAKFGQVTMGACCAAAREVANIDGTTPIRSDIDRFVVAGREFARDCSGPTVLSRIRRFWLGFVAQRKRAKTSETSK